MARPTPFGTRSGSLRASDADRDRIVERLRGAAAEGRLAPEELDHRVHAALTAVTYGELDATVRDLPSERGERPERRRAGGWNSPAATSARTLGPFAARALRANPLLIVFLIPLAAVTGAMLIAASAVWAVFMIVVFALGARSVSAGPCAARRRVGSPRR